MRRLPRRGKESNEQKVLRRNRHESAGGSPSFQARRLRRGPSVEHRLSLKKTPYVLLVALHLKACVFIIKSEANVKRGKIYDHLSSLSA